MKAFKFFIVLFLVGTLSFGQNPKVVSAFNYLKSGQLDKAKENIDAACEHPQTQNQAKTWLYKGNIYLAIALTENEKYRSLHPEPLKVALEAYQKSLALDPEYVQPMVSPPSAKIGVLAIAEKYYNTGVDLYNAKQFEKALEYFQQSKQINQSISRSVDTLSTFNAALTALQLKKEDLTIQYLQELVSAGVKSTEIYSMLITLYIDQKEFDRAEAVLNRAKRINQNDINVIISEVNFYIAKGDLNKSKEALERAIQQNPTNPVLYFNIGANYDQLMSKNEQMSDDERMTYYKQAEQAYLKAIELKPDYFDAIYNLGALYYNEGLRLFNLAQSITDFRLYAEKEKEFLEYWSQALPYLEKAHELDPNDLQTMLTLKALYVRLNQMDKLKVIDERIKARQSK